MFNISIECESFQLLFHYLKGLLLNFWLHFSPTLLIFERTVLRRAGRGSPYWSVPGPGKGDH